VGLAGGWAGVRAFITWVRQHAVRDDTLATLDANVVVIRDKLFKTEIQALQSLTQAFERFQTDVTSLRTRVDAIDRQVREWDGELASLPDAINELSQAARESSKLIAETRERVAHLEGAQVPADKLVDAISSAVERAMGRYLDQQNARAR
jgi:chromosome segregation ATPase